MKAIILAGGSGTRLYPMTKSVCKQLLPIYDKPMLYYPLSTLMMAGIKDILIITTIKDLPLIENLLETGSKLGLNISYKIQTEPKGIAESFIIGEEFIGNDNICLILGDNIFYGNGIVSMLKTSLNQKNGASIFAYRVSDPSRYGVVEFDSTNKATSIIEKPEFPKSSWAVTGLYVYDSRVVEIAKNLKPSKRGELEITDVNNVYLNEGSLRVNQFPRGVAWLDTGTYDSMLQASHFVQTVEKRQSLKIACLEEIALDMNFISSKEAIALAQEYKNDYKDYILRIVDEKEQNAPNNLNETIYA